MGDERNGCIIILHMFKLWRFCWGNITNGKSRKEKQEKPTVPLRLCSSYVTARLWANQFISQYHCISTSKITDTTTSSKKLWKDSLSDGGTELWKGKVVLPAMKDSYFCKAQPWLLCAQLKLHTYLSAFCWYFLMSKIWHLSDTIMTSQKTYHKQVFVRKPPYYMNKYQNTTQKVWSKFYQRRFLRLPVNYSCPVKMLNRQDKLPDIFACFMLLQSFFLIDLVHQVATRAQLHDKIVAVFSF